MQDTPDVQVISSTPDPENGQMELVAKMAAGLLGTKYPNHMWAVGWAPGMTLVIKNMGIEQGNYGFTVDVARAATVSELEKSIVFGGGELLERCGVPRGAWNGEFMSFKHLDYNVGKQEK